MYLEITATKYYGIWKIEKDDFDDYIFPDLNILLDEYCLKNDITYNQLDLVISTDIISDYDLLLVYDGYHSKGCYFDYDGYKIFFGSSFTKKYLTDNSNLYIKYIIG